ncbi:MAG: serine/threonine protein kinase, partial [Candidatus Aminicenantes bacterium]|nr:serine/threonine protein kinase [Candidatus Aminicenantes bacterium]
MIDKIIGNYRIIRKIGEGGMGTVFLAKDLTLEREVALKIINPTFASNSRLMARFKIEAIAQARLNHPNVITIFSFEQVGDLYFIVMEYIEGESLKDIIKKKKLTPEKALHIFRQVLNAIEFAHRKGIIHRDIKPGNIIITRDWIARIGDFGIAKIEGVEGLTREGTSLGTPLYSSPEQILGKNVDLRTDIYSLGVVLFEMLTGRPPFISEKGSEYEIQKAHIEQLPPRPSSINPLIPYKMDKIILKCLEKEPEKRYETVSELLQDFIKISARDFKFSKFAFLRSLVEFFDKTKLFFRGFSQELRTNRKFFYLTLSVLILSLLLVIILATSKVSEPLESRGLYPSVSTLKNKEEPQNAKGVESL